MLCGADAARAAVRHIPLTKPFARGRVERADQDTLLVRLQPGANARSLGVRVLRTVPGTDYALVAVDGPVERALGRLRRDPRVARAQPNWVRSAFTVPNDRLYRKGVFQRPYLERLRAPLAWSTQTGSHAQVLAVLDTGVDADTPDLAGRLLPGYDFVGNDADPADDNGHGTMVTGIAAAAGNDGVGMTGVAWDASVLPVKVLDADGAGTDASVAAGITWAADHGATVINLSLGGPQPSDVLKQAVDYALARDVVVVAAAGNDGHRTPSYPAAYPGVVAVGATDWSGNIAFFSNWGPWVDIAAPGMSVGGPVPAPGACADYAAGDGTSFSAPLVAGAALLVRSANTLLTGPQVVSRIEDGARDAGPPGFDDAYGHGVLDLAAALGAAPAGPATMPQGDRHEPNNTMATATPLHADPSGQDLSIQPQISVEGEADWYALDIAQPGVFNVSATPPDYNFTAYRAEEMDAVLDVYAPDGRLMRHVDEYGVRESEDDIEYVLKTGRYYVRVSNAGPSRTVMNYQMGLMVSATQPGRFERFAASNVGPTSAQGVAIADVTGDGRNDILMTTSAYIGVPDIDWKLFLWEGRADGSLEQTRVIATDASNTSGAQQLAVATGDLDGDGKTDAAVAVGSGVDVFLQQNGTLAAPTLVPAGGAQQVVIADVNGDRRNDMLVDSRSTGVTLLVNAPDGWHPQTVTPQFQQEIEAGDVTGDGRVDVVGWTDPASTPATVHVFAQLLDGTFAPAADYQATVGYWSGGGGIAVEDVTGDGRKDVLLSIGGNSPGALVNVFAQGGDGRLAPPTVFNTPDIPGALATGDFNGDGRPDLLALHDGWEEASIWLQAAAGGLVSPADSIATLPYASSYEPKGVAVGDVNGDGAVDFAVADYNNGLVVVRQLGLDQGVPGWALDASPADLATGVAADAAPAVRFGRALDPASLTADTVQLLSASGAPVAATATWDAVSQTIQVHPSAPLAAGGYSLEISGVRGASGLAMPTDFVTRFVVGAAPDTTPPDTVLLAAPPASSVNASPRFVFASTEPDEHYECAEDGGQFFPCRSPYHYTYALVTGAHTEDIRAVDGSGNADPTPAHVAYTITPPPSSAPSNDFGPGQLLGGSSGSVTGSNVGATWYYEELPVEGNAGGRGVWFNWTASADGPATFTTSGTGWDTLLAVYELTTPSTLPQIAGNDDVSVADQTSRVTFDAVAGTTYYIVVNGFDDGSDGAMGSFTLSWSSAGSTVDTAPPSVTLTAPAEGAWVGPSVQLSATAADDVGLARVEFLAGSTLIATDTEPPYTATWNPTGFTQGTSVPITAHAVDTSGKSADSTHNVFVDTTPPDTTITAGPSGTVTSPTATFSFSADEAGTTFFCTIDYYTTAACTSPQTYSGVTGGPHTFEVWAIDRAGNADPTHATRSWTLSNDMFAAASVADANPGLLVSGSNVGATKEAGEPNHAGNRGGHSIWWRFTPRWNGTMTIDTQGSTFDTLLAAYTGSAVSALTQVAANDNAGTATWSRVSFAVTAGTTYRIAVDGRGGRTGNVTMAFSGQPAAADTTPPDTTITSGPSGTVSATSATFAFSSTEAGSSFECRLDGSSWSACTSPQSYSGLSFATHTFDVRATDTAGNIDPTPATQTWTISNAPADVTPPDTTIDSGPAASTTSTSATFTFSASEAGSTFQCQLDGSLWSACSSPAGYSGLAVGAHTFQVRATDAAGNTDQTPATQSWSVTAPASTSNDAFAAAHAIGGISGTVNASTVGMTKETGEPNHAGNAGGHSIWYAWTAPSAGTVTFDTVGSNFDTLLAVYTGTSVSALTQVAANDDAVGTQSRLSFSAVAGTVYQVAVDGFAGASGSVTLSWSVAAGATNDAFASPQPLSGATGSWSGTNTTATKEAGEPNHAGNAGGHSIWFSWTAPAGGPTTFKTAGSTFDTLLAVYTGTAVSALTQLAANDDANGTLQSQLSFTASPGVTYRIAVDGFGGATGSVTLAWSQP